MDITRHRKKINFKNEYERITDFTIISSITINIKHNETNYIDFGNHS